MSPEGQQILSSLGRVSDQRARRQADAALGQGVQAVKSHQHRRFEHTYADMLRHPQYARAARFFLDDLYGPGDFTQRDDQFARIVPPLVRLFPREIVQTVVSLAELHALSEELDSAMAQALQGQPLDNAHYAQAWRRVGRAADRERQIALMLEVGGALDRYTRKPLLRHSLRLMRGPAQAAGLGALQQFLETGFDTFRGMPAPKHLLDNIAARERALAAQLFAGGQQDDAVTTATPAG